MPRAAGMGSTGGSAAKTMWLHSLNKQEKYLRDQSGMPFGEVSMGSGGDCLRAERIVKG